MYQLSIFDVANQEETPNEVAAINYLLIDGNNLLNRAYYATEQSHKRSPLLAPDGRPTNAVMSFMRMLLNYQTQLDAKAFVFFDKGAGFRKVLYPAYKEGRNEKPEDLKLQFPIIKDVLRAAQIPFFEHDEYEADDLIACACVHNKGQKYILSNDKDLLQLVKDDVTVIQRKGSNDVYVTPMLFKEQYEGLEPSRITDLKALAGDSSDNIPGINGIGDKGAMKIVQVVGELSNLSHFKDWSALKRYEKYFDEEGIHLALFYRELTTLKQDVVLNLNTYEIEKAGLQSICKGLALNTILAMI